MRVLITFQFQDGYWKIHVVDNEVRRSISAFTYVETAESLLSLLRYVGATDAQLETAKNAICRWNCGTVRVDLAPGRKNVLLLDDYDEAEEIGHS